MILLFEAESLGVADLTQIRTTRCLRAGARTLHPRQSLRRGCAVMSREGAPAMTLVGTVRTGPSVEQGKRRLGDVTERRAFRTGLCHDAHAANAAG